MFDVYNFELWSGGEGSEVQEDTLVDYMASEVCPHSLLITDGEVKQQVKNEEGEGTHKQHIRRLILHNYKCLLDVLHCHNGHACS